MRTVANENSSGIGDEMSYAAKNADEHLKVAIKSVCMKQYVSLRGFWRLWSRLARIFVRVHPLNCKSLYNTRRVTEIFSVEHDRLVLQDMCHFVESGLTLMDLGPHGPMFCSALQFKKLYKPLVEKNEKLVRREQVLKSEGPATGWGLFSKRVKSNSLWANF